jgi:hypothetical protein
LKFIDPESWSSLLELSVVRNEWQAVTATNTRRVRNVWENDQSMDEPHKLVSDAPTVNLVDVSLTDMTVKRKIDVK